MSNVTSCVQCWSVGHYDVILTTTVAPVCHVSRIYIRHLAARPVLVLYTAAVVQRTARLATFHICAAVITFYSCYVLWKTQTLIRGSIRLDNETLLYHITFDAIFARQ